MAAVAFTRTPPRNYLSIGAWQEFKERLATIESILAENSDYTTAKTVAEFKTALDDVIAAISGVL